MKLFLFLKQYLARQSNPHEYEPDLLPFPNSRHILEQFMENIRANDEKGENDSQCIFVDGQTNTERSSTVPPTPHDSVSSTIDMDMTYLRQSSPLDRPESPPPYRRAKSARKRRQPLRLG
jgi:hypothetical protein